MNRSRLAALLLFAVLTVPLWAADDATDDPVHNAVVLDKWKSDPGHYALLRHNAERFGSLPREQQERMRRLDHDLHECDPETQRHLLVALERYAAWLDQLPEADQKQILGIADRKERIKAIKAKYEQQWFDHLPAKERERLKNQPDDQRAAAMARMHHDDMMRHEKWQHDLKLRPDMRPRSNKSNH
jgi:hypothetical protein